MPNLERLKEVVRPYYLRWIYFPMRPERRPDAFTDCWKYPFDKVDGSVRLPEPPSNLPDLIIYPMTDWHTRIQRTQHLVRAFADLGFRSVYINPHLGRQFETTPLFDRAHRLAQLGTNIFELHIRLPNEPVFHHRLLTPKEEHIIASAIRCVLPPRGKAIQILSFPLWLGVARQLRNEANFPIVYDCHDLLCGFQNVCADIVDAEADLFQAADLLLFSSQELIDRYAAGHKRLLIRNAVNAGQFQIATTPEQVAGYIGALDSWFDIDAVEQAARLNPQCRFVLAGRIESKPIERLKSLPNVEFTGEIPHERIPALLAQFRVALIPFRINALTLATNPIKLYEYFSCGLPVVSTPLPEVQAMGDLVWVGATPDEFARQVERALHEDDPARRARRREIAVHENWTARARNIGAEFEALLNGARSLSHG